MNDKVKIGNCAVIPLDLDNELSVLLEIRKIEDNKVYFGRSIGSTIRKEDILISEQEDEHELKKGSVLSLLVYWKSNKEMFELFLEIFNIKGEFVYFSSCEGFLPLEFIESEEIKVV